MARKQVEADLQTKEETVVLELLQKLNHPNIIEFLGSYVYRGYHNLLFPLADMDLHKFFRADIQLPADVLLSEIHGIADGLAHIHKFILLDGQTELKRIGYHHDLRPANILFVGKKFVITDFGLSKLKPDDETSKSKLRGGHDDYLGPEAFDEIDWSNGKVGRALDVWALGCIIVEFATYMANLSVEKFKNSREGTIKHEWMSVTNCAFHSGGALRPAVDTWLSQLTASLSSNHSKLVELARKMLDPNWRKRIDINVATLQLSIINLHSKATAVEHLLTEHTHCELSCTRTMHVFVLLEAMRFHAWYEAYRSMNENYMFESIQDTLSILNMLQKAITSLVYTHNNSATSNCDFQSPDTFNHVVKIIDSLSKALPKHQQRDMDELWTQSVTDIESMDILQQIQTSSIPVRYHAVGIKSAMKYMSRAISKSIRTGGRKMLLDAGEIEIGGDDQFDCVEIDEEEITRSSGFCDDLRVLVEWIRYDPRWKESQGDAMLTRMENLARFLNPNETTRSGILKDRILECLGYFHDSKRWKFGFAYLIPPDSNGAALNVFALENIIRADQRNTTRPDLGEVFRLGQVLVGTVDALHEVGWLHKSISSHNILIQSNSKDAACRKIGSAVLAGLSQSRPEVLVMTLGPTRSFRLYHHPHYIESGSSFKRTYDFFSVGIVLLELGLWCTMAYLLEHDTSLRKPVSQSTAQENQKILLKKYVPQLGERVGAVYRDAVVFCLNAEEGFGSSSDTTEGRRAAQRAFREHVVDSLAGCHA